MENPELTMGSYLSFKLRDEEFAVHVNSVLNIIELPKITTIPKAPYYMKGVINLRGNVLPVIDLRLRFNMNETEFTPKTCIIVMDIVVNKEEILIGSLVDSVASVLEVDKKDILIPPKIGNDLNTEFITGMIKTDDKFIMILDVEKIFSVEELIKLNEKSTESEKI